jgi:hypothetical protein
MTRQDSIDGAIGGAAALISDLLDHGEVTPEQSAVIVAAAVRSAVPDVKPFEIRLRAAAVATDLEHAMNCKKLTLTKRRKRP